MDRHSNETRKSYHITLTIQMENTIKILCQILLAPIQGRQGTSSGRRSFDFTSLAGRFAPKIAKKFPFAQTAEAYRYLESNQQVGNIVITVP
jgi:Zinc-binding dehydrogenase